MMESVEPFLTQLADECIKGFLCNPHDIQSIAGTLRKLINTTQWQIESIGTKNRQKAEKLLEPGAIVSAYLQLLSK
jgi:transposase-like protein